MKKVHSDTLKRARLLSDIHHSTAQKEIRARQAAYEKLEKLESVGFKSEMAQRKCIQPLYKLEKEWTNAKNAKVKDEAKIEQARQNILKGLDQAATDSLARIMSEIKQKDLANKDLCKKELQQVEISVEEFYSDFQNICNKFEYFVTQEEFNKIIAIYKEQNLKRIKELGSLVGYNKPAEKFEENIELLKDCAIKENDLTV